MTRKPIPIKQRGIEGERRAPRQSRSLQTIDTLFQATAQILEREGETGLTTNKVASVAGFSIGTLYQYFPSKDALIRGIMQRVQDQLFVQMDSYLYGLKEKENLSQIDPDDLVNEALALVIQGMTLEGKNKSLLRLFWILEQPDQISMASQKMAEKLSLFIENLDHPRIKSPSTTEMFVITRSVLGLVRYASIEKSSLLGSGALEKIAGKMILAVLLR